MKTADDDNEMLEVRWLNFGKDYDIHSKRFKRMGALLEWIEANPNIQVTLSIVHKTKKVP